MEIFFQKIIETLTFFLIEKITGYQKTNAKNKRYFFHHMIFKKLTKFNTLKPIKILLLMLFTILNIINNFLKKLKPLGVYEIAKYTNGILIDHIYLTFLHILFCLNKHHVSILVTHYKPY